MSHKQDVSVVPLRLHQSTVVCGSPAESRWSRCYVRRHSFLRTISGSCQVMSNHGSSGPYRRSSGHHDLPGSVGIQLESLPSGAVGANHSTYEPSFSAWISSDRLDSAGYG